MKRDLSINQYVRAMRKDGWTPEAFGYWQLDGYGTSVCALNAGKRRRDRLNYMRIEKGRIIANAAVETPTK